MQSAEGPVSKAKSGGNNPLSPPVFPNPETGISEKTGEKASHRARALVSSWHALTEGRQHAIDRAAARSFIYRFLAKSFEAPTPKGWRWLSTPAIQTTFCSVVRKITLGEETGLRERAKELVAQLHPGQFEPFWADYVFAFGQASQEPKLQPDRTACWGQPLPEPALPLSFFRSFGLELAGPAAERQDHICIALEFMSVLTAKEAYALEREWQEQAAGYSDAQQKFLGQHLGLWAPAFCRGLRQNIGPGVLASLANFTQAFAEIECRRRDSHSQFIIKGPPKFDRISALE